MRTSFIASVFVSSAVLALAAAPAAAATSWLDAKPVAAWNIPGAAIPKAPADTSGNIARCKATIRAAQTPVDHLVAAAGWKLFGPYQLYNGTSLVFAESAADGMCRPAGYQAFLFVNGKFAGTLAPKPMDDRADGALAVPRLFDGSSLSGEFSRYSDTDALCCPSRTTSLDYKVVRRPAGPVVIPGDASTTKNSS